MSGPQTSVPNPTGRKTGLTPELERKLRELGLNLVTSERDPDWVDVIFDWRWTWPVARLRLTALFLLGAVIEILDFPAAAAVQEQYGLYPGWVWAIATIAVQLVGSGIIISGRHVWLGAGMLAVFTGATELVAHRFWELIGAAAFQERNEFVEHLGLVAGLIMVALLAEERNRRGRRGPARRTVPRSPRQGRRKASG
jgi:uncharacterized membrane protein YphA (DoxX/SURF4 family)